MSARSGVAESRVFDLQHEERGGRVIEGYVVSDGNGGIVEVL